MSTQEPNMGLFITTIGEDSGLTWEENTNANALTIGGHTHSPGSGMQITPSGLNINSNLSFQNQQAINLQAAVFTPQTSITTLDCIYFSGVDLYANDGAGNVIQITSGGGINATSSGISNGTASASFVSGVLVVNEAAATPANIQAGSLLIGNNTANSKFLTLAPPNAMAASYQLNLPIIPSSKSFLSIDTSGNIAAYVPISGGITTSNISASAGITGSQLSASANIIGTQLAFGANILGSQIDPAAGIVGSQIASVIYGTVEPSYGVFAASAAAGSIGSGSIAITAITYTRQKTGANSFYLLVGSATSSTAVSQIMGSGSITPTGSGVTSYGSFSNGSGTNAPANFTLFFGVPANVSSFTVDVEAHAISGSFIWPAMTFTIIEL
jgi:hypothetical protein